VGFWGMLIGMIFLNPLLGAREGGSYLVRVTLARNCSWLQAVVENRINAFIFDEAILKHLVKTEYPAQLRVLAETLNHYYIGMAVPPSSPLLERINRALLRVMAQEEWDRLMEQYLGSSS